MGNGESSPKALTPTQRINAVIGSPRYPAIKTRIEKMGIQLTIQGDGSLYLQNPQDLVKGNRSIPGPETADDVDETLNQVVRTLEDWMKDCGYVYAGYQ